MSYAKTQEVDPSNPPFFRGKSREPPGDQLSRGSLAPELGTDPWHSTLQPLFKDSIILESVLRQDSLFQFN